MASASQRKDPAPITSAGAWCAPITGFRALAAIAVAVGHSFLSSRIYPMAGVVQIIGVIVPMFFVVSAYALYRPFIVDQIGRREPQRARDFWWRRFLRIYPLYFVALSTYLIFLPPLRPKGGNPLDYLKLYAFLQVYFPNLRDFSGIPAAWFLCDEVAFYLMIPALAFLAYRWAVRRSGGRPTTEIILRSHARLAGVMWVIGFVCRPFFIARMGLPGAALPFSNLDFYGAGILIGVATLWEREGLPLPEPVIWLREHGGAAAAGMLIGALCIELAATDPANWTHRQNIFRYLMWTVMTIPAMVYLIMGDQKSKANTWLSDKRWLWLAALSLHVYLWHQFVLGAFDKYVTQIADLTIGPRFTTGIIIGIGCAVITIALSATLRPALDWPYSRWAGPKRAQARLRAPARPSPSRPRTTSERARRPNGPAPKGPPPKGPPAKRPPPDQRARAKPGRPAGTPSNGPARPSKGPAKRTGKGTAKGAPPRARPKPPPTDPGT